MMVDQNNPWNVVEKEKKLGLRISRSQNGREAGVENLIAEVEEEEAWKCGKPVSWVALLSALVLFGYFLMSLVKNLMLKFGQDFEAEGLASYCKANTTFTFYFSIINA